MGQSKIPLQIIERLREASRIFVREQGVLRAEQRGASITYTQGHTLIELERHEPLTVVELAGILKLNKSSASRTLTQMRKRGWVCASEDPSDTRKKLYLLTAEGRRQLQKLHREASRRVESALLRLSEKDRTTVLAGMELYASALKKEQS